MRTIDVIQGSSNRNQRLRLLMLLIIIGTFPFYCLGIILIGSAPLEGYVPPATATEAIDATFTPLGLDQPASTRVSASPLPFPSNTPLSILQPTPRQFVPPTSIPTDHFVAQTVESPAPTAAVEPFGTVTIIDADGDGITDNDDGCPDDFGYADNDGCPYPDDPDRDGIRGDADVCPNEWAPNSPRGCSDFDDDGLDTSEDDCPQERGPISNRGCPVDGGG